MHVHRGGHGGDGGSGNLGGGDGDGQGFGGRADGGSEVGGGAVKTGASGDGGCAQGCPFESQGPATSRGGAALSSQEDCEYQSSMATAFESMSVDT